MLKPVTDPNEKSRIFDALVEHVAPGRGADARPPSSNERNGTALMSMPLKEASAKIRTGPPIDDEEDYNLPVWAGVLPLTLQPGVPIPDDRLNSEISCPDYVQDYTRTQ